ncbi:MAG TPA: nucleotide exchange factor GrpE [Candidatus Binataceae bacterium]|nr:nucleotide exchange factor GrpE [Candidatus Binataceae bacterium]
MHKQSKDVNSENKDPAAPASADATAGATVPGGTAAAAESQAGSEIEQLRGQQAAKDREISELKDKYLRALAEMDNVRKRARQQSEETVRVQRENLLRDLLPIVDNLERALEAARGGANRQSITEGVEMVLRSIHDLLRTHGVIPIAAVGQQFDPQVHEAVDHVSSEEHPPNTVVSEFHRGYLIGERMLRPARVSVSKGDTDGASRGESNDANG